MKNKTNKLVLAGLLVALSFVGANLKVMGTVAFDSLPAFLGTLLLGYGWGAAIGAVGHLLTALTSGFPLSFPVHLVTAAMMAATMVVFLGVIRFCAFLRGSEPISYMVAVFAAAVVNGPLALLVLTPMLLPVMGMGGILGMVPILTLVAAVNAALAVLVYRLLPKKLRERKKQTNENR